MNTDINIHAINERNYRINTLIKYHVNSALITTKLATMMSDIHAKKFIENHKYLNEFD